FASVSGCASLHVGSDEIPVHQVPERLDVLRPGVAIVDVVRVFPDVAGEQRGVLAGQRGRRVRRADQRDRAIRTLHQPAPAGTEGFYRVVTDLVLERGEIPKSFGDRSHKLAPG